MTGFDGGPSKNVHLVDAARNHQVYGVPGDKKDWSIDGHFWASPVKFGSRSDHPSYWEDLELMGAPASPYGFGGMRNVWSTNGVNVEVDGFLMDLSETTVAEDDVEAIATDNNGKYDPSVNGNSGNVYRNITIKTSVDDAVTLSRSFGQHAPILWENVTIEDNGMPMNIGTPFNSHVYNITYRNVDVIPQGNLGVLSSAPDRIGVQGYSSNVTNIPNVPEALWRVFDNVNYQRAFDTPFFGFGADQEDGLVAFDQWIVDSSFDNRSGGQFFRVATNNVNAIKTSHEWFALFMDNTTINVQSDMHQWVEAEIVRMRGSQDREGRTSDNSGTYTSDASDEGNDYVVIPTDLMSHAWEKSATVTSGAPSVTSIEVANSDGSTRTDTEQPDPYLRVNLNQTIGSGNTIDVDWTARVTPQDKYQTTGLFVARPVADQTYTSGNGPFTVDLRGVAACQESREYIQYSASSGDTSVVTASVPTAEQGQPPTLTLTEQGTGTTTITVTGEISGVGTASTTFDVTIS